MHSFFLLLFSFFMQIKLQRQVSEIGRVCVARFCTPVRRREAAISERTGVQPNKTRLIRIFIIYRRLLAPPERSATLTHRTHTKTKHQSQVIPYYFHIINNNNYFKKCRVGWLFVKEQKADTFCYAQKIFFYTFTHSQVLPDIF